MVRILSSDIDNINQTFVKTNSKELAVSLAELRYKLEDVQSMLNDCGMTRLIIKLITCNQHQEVSGCG